MKKWYIFMLLFIGFVLPTRAQPPADSLNAFATDTTEAKVPFFDFRSDYPNPNKSAILSFALPGAGQAYNKRWWKLPLVYGAFAGMFYAIDFNQGLYRRFRDALQMQLAGQEHEFSGTVIDSSNALRGLRDQYDRNTQLSYIGTVLLYGVVAVEAFVDAHLLQFDIDENLSMQMAPQVIPLPDQFGSAGVAVIVRF
jgi:hypothetical protein